MTIPSFEVNFTVKRFLEKLILATLTTNKRQISPLIEYLYLNPLYSILGGSTTRADPFTKYPVRVLLRWKPL